VVIRSGLPHYCAQAVFDLPEAPCGPSATSGDKIETFAGGGAPEMIQADLPTQGYHVEQSWREALGIECQAYVIEPVVLILDFEPGDTNNRVHVTEPIPVLERHQPGQQQFSCRPTPPLTEPPERRLPRTNGADGLHPPQRC
jgi:hypothetical protein